MKIPPDAPFEEILQAGICYAELAVGQVRDGDCETPAPPNFPWLDEYWIPGETAAENCSLACRLITSGELGLRNGRTSGNGLNRPGVPFRGGFLYQVQGTIYEWSWKNYRFNIENVYVHLKVRTIPPRGDILKPEGVAFVVQTLNAALHDREFSEVLEEVEDLGG